MSAGTDVVSKSTLEALRKASLTERQARALFRQGEEAVVFALLELTKQLAEARVPADTPQTPSGMKPIYQKPTTPRRRKRPGAQSGHAGHRRPIPERIDQRREHRLPCCPDCGARLKRTGDRRTRYTEDIPAGITPQVTQHTIHRDWCPRCQKRVEPKVPDALPHATLGNRTLVLSAWLHYGLGTTSSQILEVFNHHLQLKLTKGGLIQMWHRLAEVMEPWYQQIAREGRKSAVLHADETGWRVAGQTHWLWCFGNPSLTYYMIDRKRGSPAVLKFFREEFGGTLVCDFWGAYNFVVCGGKQRCLVHLLGDLERVEKYKRPGKHWSAFAKKLRRLVRDGIRLKKADDLAPETYASRRARIQQRLEELIATDRKDPEANRLVKRLRRHREELFTFLDKADVPFDNNHAERQIRPAVIMRKNTYCNRSQRGAQTQAVLMSVYRSLKQRNHDPIQTITNALSEYLTTGKLPPLPPKAISNG